MKTRYVTPEEVATWLKVSPSTVRRWIRDGKLLAVKIGPRQWRVAMEDLEVFVGADRGLDRDEGPGPSQ